MVSAGTQDKVHIHKFDYGWATSPTSVGRCQCGATTEGRNRISHQEADRLLGLDKRKIKEDKPMAVSTPAVTTPKNGSGPLPLEFSMNDLYISSFGFKLSSEYEGETVDRVEFSGDTVEIKRLQEKIKAGAIVVTLKFRPTT